MHTASETNESHATRVFVDSFRSRNSASFCRRNNIPLWISRISASSDRSVEENLALFEAMSNGELADGEAVLRRLNPRASVVRAQFARVPLDCQLLGCGACRVAKTAETPPSAGVMIRAKRLRALVEQSTL